MDLVGVGAQRGQQALGLVEVAIAAGTLRGGRKIQELGGTDVAGRALDGAGAGA